MTSGNEFKLGGNNGNSVDLAKLKSGVKRADFESDAKMLQIFDAVDTNANQTLDMDEVTLFTESMKSAANGDDTITKQEAQQVFQAQQEKAKAQGEDAKKYDIKAKDLFGFVNRFLDASERSNVKSSVVDEQGNQTLTYEDGSQEILNKDGSKILVQVIDGKKVSKTLDKNGDTTEESITDEESGDTETLSYENGKLKSHVVKSGTTTNFLGVDDGYSKGKPIRQIINQGTENEQTVEYNYTGDNSYTVVSRMSDIEESVVVTDGKLETSSKVQYKNGQKVQEYIISHNDGTQTRRFFENGKLKADAVTTSDGTTTQTLYNESERKVQSVIQKADGTVYKAEYDGKGSTLVVVQNGETIDRLGKKFDRTTAEIASNNKGTVHYQDGSPYFLAGETVRISGEFAPDYRGLQGRATSEQVQAQYAQQEQQRVAQRLQGKELKEITVDRDYANLTDYARDLLRSELGREPSKEEFTDKANELALLNGGSIVPKKGMTVRTTKTEADIKAEQARAQQQHSQQVKVDAINDLVGDYNKAVRSFNNQMEKDGWAADVADAVSYIWNNDAWSATGNTARQVRQDLAAYKETIQDLKAARREGEPQFKAKFKETFGVEYNQQNMEAYQASRDKLREVSTIVATEKAVTARMDELFANYDKEKAIVDKYKNSSNTLVDERKLNNAQFAVQREIQTLLGLSDSDMIKLSQDLQSKGKSLDINYMRQLYGEIKTGLAQQRTEALNGKTIEQYQAEKDAAYKKAFGNRTDIVERVADYNDSQDTGAAVVKVGAKIVGSALVAAATGGTASGLLIGALGSAAVSFGVDATDMMSDGRTHTLGEYGLAAGNALVDAGTQVISGGTSRILKAAEVGKVTRYAAQATVDMALDGSVDYMRTGEFHLSTFVMSGAASVGGEMIGDFLEARAARQQMDLGKVDNAAVQREYGSVDSGWLASTEEIERINHEHSRYSVTVTADEIGGIKTADIGSAIRGVVDDPGHIRVDVSSTQMRDAVADVANLGIDTNSAFGRGLVKLENVQQSKSSYSASVSGKPKFDGASADNVTPYGTFRRNQQVVAMGLQDDISLVQDAATISGKAYSNNPKNQIDGWGFLASSAAENGFSSTAYAKDGKIMIAFRGSDDTSDLVSDFSMMAGRTPEQLQHASDFVAKIKEQYPDAKIIVTGHSLGGSLTEMVASQYDDVLGITFDAVGTRHIVESAGGAMRDNHNTVNYIVNGDVLSNVDAHVGQVVLTDAVVQGGKLNSAHSISNFIGNGNNSLSGVESGIVARTVDANAKQTRLSDLINQSGASVKMDERSFKRIASQFEYDVNTLGADLDVLQSQIKSVADAGQRAQLQSMIDSRRVTITQGTDITANSHTIKSMSGDEINDVLARDFGFTEPGFLGGNTPSAEIVVDKPTKLVRVFNDENAFAKGSWLMPYNQIVGKSPEEIKDFFALPNMPKYIVEVEVPEGTRMFTGLCNPLEGWGNGGGTQFFVVGDVRPKQYGQMRLISGATN